MIESTKEGSEMFAEEVQFWTETRCGNCCVVHSRKDAGEIRGGNLRFVNSSDWMDVVRRLKKILSGSGVELRTTSHQVHTTRQKREETIRTKIFKISNKQA